MPTNEEHFLEYGSDYTVSKLEDQDTGGTLTLLNPLPPEAEQLIIRRVTPKTQEIDLHNGARLPAELIEGMGDKVTMQVQEIASAIEAEAEERKAADQILAEAIDKETEERKAADKTLEEAIEAEAEERKAADQILAEAIDKETEERKAADKALRDEQAVIKINVRKVFEYLGLEYIGSGGGEGDYSGGNCNCPDIDIATFDELGLVRSDVQHGNVLVDPDTGIMTVNGWEEILKRLEQINFLMPAPPTVEVCDGQELLRPANSVILTGAAYSEDSTIEHTLWEQVEGPAGAVIAAPDALSTEVTGMNEAGIYIFRFTATDAFGQTALEDVIIAVNYGEITVSAGNNRTVLSPIDHTTLSGTASSPNGEIVEWEWTKVYGIAEIDDPTNQTTEVTGLEEGVITKFSLKVTDEYGQTGYAEVTVSCEDAMIIVSAGNDATIKLPASSTNLSGTATSPDGAIVKWEWEKISGSGTITNPNIQNTTVTGLEYGTSQFRLTVTDSVGRVASAEKSVTVEYGIVTVSAGSASNITYPASSTTLAGSASSPNGSIVQYEWTKVSGSGNIASPDTASTGVTGLGIGTARFRLTVTDSVGITAYAEKTVTVAYGLITVNISASTTSITLPTNSVGLSGSASSPNGTITKYAWTRVSGTGTIASPSSASTTITGMTQGTSRFRLTVTDSVGQTNYAEISITVNAQATPSHGSKTFTSTGTFTVPAGVYSIDIVVQGAGGGGSDSNCAGGVGGTRVTTTKAVTPGQQISVTVGKGARARSGNPSTCIVTASGGTAGSYGTDGGSAFNWKPTGILSSNIGKFTSAKHGYRGGPTDIRGENGEPIGTGALVAVDQYNQPYMKFSASNGDAGCGGGGSASFTKISSLSYTTINTSAGSTQTPTGYNYQTTYVGAAAGGDGFVTISW